MLVLDLNFAPGQEVGSGAQAWLQDTISLGPITKFGSNPNSGYECTLHRHSHLDSTPSPYRPLQYRPLEWSNFKPNEQADRLTVENVTRGYEKHKHMIILLTIEITEPEFPKYTSIIMDKHNISFLY